MQALFQNKAALQQIVPAWEMLQGWRSMTKKTPLGRWIYKLSPPNTCEKYSLGNPLGRLQRVLLVVIGANQPHIRSLRAIVQLIVESKLIVNVDRNGITAAFNRSFVLTRESGKPEEHIQLQFTAKEGDKCSPAEIWNLVEKLAELGRQLRH